MSGKTSSKKASTIMMAFGTLVMLWVAAAFVGALHQVNWQVGELARQYMLATGMMKPLHTLVDFYSHIKGIEYLICVAFFVAFPIFFKYVNKEKRPVTVQG
jgi:ABC-type bacteriocin/lantibiotic exporter with double-glycine peptidase domain